MGMETVEKQPEMVVAFHTHSSDVGYDLRRAGQMFELIRNLGGNGMRIELSWFDVQPEKNVWDKGMLDWHKKFFQAAESSGITPIVNLAGAPSWATQMLRHDRHTFIQSWRAYCERAIEMMDGHVRFIQVWNEPNNPILQVVEPCHAHVGIFRHDFFHEMLNVTASLLRPAIRPLEILINVTADLPGWQLFVTECIRQARDSFDIIGMDAYPGTYLPTNWREFRDLSRLLERVNDPGDLWFSKQAALIEFGYSTFLPPLRSETKQLEWADAILTAVRRENQLWRERQAKSLRLVSWYELYDESSTLPLNFLAHFGLVRLPNQRRNGQRKPAYETVRQHLRALHKEAA